MPPASSHPETTVPSTSPPEIAELDARAVHPHERPICAVLQADPVAGNGIEGHTIHQESLLLARLDVDQVGSHRLASVSSGMQVCSFSRYQVARAIEDGRPVVTCYRVTHVLTLTFDSFPRLRENH